MKIIHLINSLGTGGAEKLVVDLSVEMRNQGHQVAILCLWGDEGVPMKLATQAGIEVIILGTRATFLMNLPQFVKLARNTDVVNVHLWPCLYLAALIRPSNRLVFTEHNTQNRRRNRRRFHGLESWAYSRYGGLISVSSGVHRSLVDHLSPRPFSGQSITIRNGISRDFLSPAGVKEVANPAKLIAIGRLDNRKHFSTAIRVMKHLPEADLKIVGTGPDFSQLAELVESLEVGDRVHFVGERTDVMQLLDESDILLSTSVHEGFALVAAEAMARGLPVVGPNIPGFNETVRDGETGVLFDENASPREIAIALERLIQSPRLYRKFSRQSVQVAKKYGINETVNSYINFYRSFA